MKHTIKIIKTNATGESTLWEGEYEDPTERTRDAELAIRWDEDDSMPALLLHQGEPVRELSGKEVDLLAEQAIVLAITCFHPNANKYGHPICAADLPEVWAATCGNMGFVPGKDLQLECEDTGDDSSGHFQLSLSLPSEVCLQIQNTTRDAVAAFAENSGESPDAAAAGLAEMTTLWGNQFDKEIPKGIPGKTAFIAARKIIRGR